MPNNLRILWFIAGFLIACSPAAAWAQSNVDMASAQVSNIPGIQGTDAKGAPLLADRLKGRVVVVFYWSTACAVCMNSLPELRANAEGWRNKPFTLVTVNVDRHADDWRRYEQILGKMQTPSPGVVSVRQNDPETPPGKLPLILLMDTQGKVVARYEGRLAPEVWDSVADLIP